MKLKLPLALLSALCICMYVAEADVASTTPIYGNNGADGNPVVDGTAENDGNFYYLSQSLIWQENYDYQYDKDADGKVKDAVLNIGTSKGVGSLSVQGEGTTVTVDGSVHIAGWGWAPPATEEEKRENPPHSGYVYVGAGAKLIGGYGSHDITNSQFNIGSGTLADIPIEAKVEVDGGTLIANGILNVALGGNSQGVLHVKNKGEVHVQLPEGQFGSGASAMLTVGYYEGSDGKVIVDDSTLTVTAEGGRSAASYLGLESSATIDVLNGGTADLSNGTGVGEVLLGYYGTGSGVINVAGSGSTLVTDSAYVGYQGSGEVNISAGGKADVGGQLSIGHAANASGEVSVSGEGSKLTVTGNTFLGKAGSGTLEISENATAALQYVSLKNDSTLSVTGGATVTAGDFWDGMTIGKGSKLVVEDGASEKSSLTIMGTLENDGTVTANLTQGGNLEAMGVENTGTMEVTLSKGASLSSWFEVNNSGTMSVTLADAESSFSAPDITNSGTLNLILAEGSTFSASSYVNAGTTTITAAEGASCAIASFDLTGGSMTLDGEGSFELGTADTGISSIFYVSGPEETTNINLASMGTGGNVKLTVDAQSAFTLTFKPEVLADIKPGTETTFTLTLIYGYEGFSVDEATLAALLENNTTYVFETASAMALAVEADVAAGALEYVVEGDQYEMQGNNLVWTGTVKAVPEPTTATLSLLALAALAARRRRK